MRPAYISVVRDDTDILPWNIRYYYNLGIRDFYLMLHVPSPELIETIEMLERSICANFNTIMKHEEEHRHDEDIKKLTDWARAGGCDWMIATDADEIIILNKHKTIFDLLTEYGKHQYLSLLFRWFEYVCDKEIHTSENPFTALQYREKEYREQTKAIGKFDNNSWFVPGLHFVMNCKNPIYVDPSVACCVHFPTRNKDQWIKKTLMHNINFTKRYGSYPLGEQIKADPVNFLPRFFDDHVLIKDLSDYIYALLDGELFR